MTDDEAMKCIDYIRDNAPKFAEAESDVVYIENYLKSLKSELMTEETGTLGAKEAFAYSHPRYIQQLQGLKVAVAIKTEIKWRMEAAKLKFEFWKTQQFNNRVEARAMS
jgi:hypothetical protein